MRHRPDNRLAERANLGLHGCQLPLVSLALQEFNMPNAQTSPADPLVSQSLESPRPEARQAWRATERAIFRQLFEPGCRAFTYILGDASTRGAVIIDPVLEAVDRDLQFLHESRLKLRYILETHLHADHITGAGRLRESTGALIAVSTTSGIRGADVSLADCSTIRFGEHELAALATPGHTEGCMSYYMDGMVFTGDCLLISGTGRTDLRGGSAEALYDSVTRRLWTLPPATSVFPAHDYHGRSCSTIDHERRFNPRIGGDRSKQQFVRLVSELRLKAPTKMSEAIPANLNCGSGTHSSRATAASDPVFSTNHGDSR
jgi:sulfur dioxygenase